ncbi:MAG: hypothetical protein ACJ8KA_10430 [Sulfurifustis sp.]
MKLSLVYYRAHPEQALQNQRLIEKVFEELRAKSPEGVRYLVLKHSDGTFVHLSAIETADGKSPIVRLAAFQPFQDGIKERCIEPPHPGEGVIVGNFRMLGER